MENDDTPTAQLGLFGGVSSDPLPPAPFDSQVFEQDAPPSGNNDWRGSTNIGNLLIED